MKKFYLFVCLLGMSLSACGGGDPCDLAPELCTGGGGDGSGVYSCYFVNPFDSEVLQCIQYNAGISEGDAQQACDDYSMGGMFETDGILNEGPCEIEGASGYCQYDDKVGYAEVAAGVTPEDDCSTSVNFTSAWGCDQDNGEFICTL